ncbi:MAG: hypothetical protein ACREFK_19445, partial [Stellaceae bacterium]
VPTVSLKRVRIPPSMVIPTMLGIGVIAGFFTTVPWPTLTAIGVVYLGSIPLTVHSYYRLRRAAEARHAEPAGTRTEALPRSLPAPPGAPLGEAHLTPREWRH